MDLVVTISIQVCSSFVCLGQTGTTHVAPCSEDYEIPIDDTVFTEAVEEGSKEKNRKKWKIPTIVEVS